MKGSMPLHAARCKGGLRVGKAHNGRWASLKRQYPEAASVKPQPERSEPAVLGGERSRTPTSSRSGQTHFNHFSPPVSGISPRYAGGLTARPRYEAAPLDAVAWRHRFLLVPALPAKVFQGGIERRLLRSRRFFVVYGAPVAIWHFLHCMSTPLPPSDTEAVKELQATYQQMREQLGQVIVGQHEVIEQLLIAIFCRGHALLVGVPGLAKTLLVSTVSRVLDLSFKRIQFTPDLMPADITGTEVLEEDHTTGRRIFRFVHGPVFANMVLADEINRTPPKTQAALLEAMQEKHVTIGENTHRLPEPFFVLATQNPIEQEGTFPLPEAQLDRFIFNILVDYPTAAEEIQVIKQITGTYQADVKTLVHADQVMRLQEIVRRVPVADHIVEYAASLARATRPKQPEAPDFVREMVGWGAGPRAGIYLITAAKARAILQGRFHATSADVAAMALPVLRHRVLTTFNAEAAGVSSDQIVKMLLEHLKPKPDLGL
jgi:MoxR-like ATPase